MEDVQPLIDAVDKLADRFRSMPQSRLLGAVPGYDSRAAAGLALARRLAALALAAEGEPERELPEAGAFAVGDQLAVAGHDLAAALTATADPAVLAQASVAVGETAALCG
ncbi:hypothetical protein [Kitasatospora sp. NPDC097643]|uniref:hypothetical protein n=1 Tax=Kitasatospora sp. NPDC097643 TaxID=3157230 RepID=UPI00332DFED3